MAASETPTLAGIEVRALARREELSEAVALEQAIWGFAPGEMIPLRLFVVASKIGGQVFGAFDGARMVGFCLAIPGIKPGGQPFLHSDMLGVLPEYRDRRIGRALKLAQRGDALSRGIALIEWTFDPLELKNAFFNMERLGAVVRRYVLNQYGATSSPLHRGLPTDRCVAEWWLAAPRVEAALGGAAPARSAVEERIEVPASIATLRREDPPRAREIQAAVSERFLDAFRRGLAVIGFENSGGAGTYLLGKWLSP
ncbi:MAG TPA: acetyltransferase [Bryobacteraceae bacterium]